MALRFLESFKTYAVGDLNKRWDYTPGFFLAFNSTGGPFNDQYARQGAGPWSMVKTIDPQTNWIIGYYLRFSALPGSDAVILQISRNLSDVQIRIKLSSTGEIKFCREDTVLATSAAVISANVWYHIQIKAEISNSIAANSCKIRLSTVGGTATDILTVATSSDTNFQATANAESFDFTQNSAYDYDLAHIYILDGTGSYNNDFIGECQIKTLYPSGNGTYSDLVGSDSNSIDNYQLVDEANGNGDTDYVESNTNGNKDSYAFDNLLTTDTIYGLQQTIYAKETSGGTDVRLFSRIVNTDYPVATSITLTNSYLVKSSVTDVSPATSARWTGTEVNNAEFGVELV